MNYTTERMWPQKRNGVSCPKCKALMELVTNHAECPKCHWVEMVECLDCHFAVDHKTKREKLVPCWRHK